MAYLMESSSEGTRLRAKTDPQRVLEELALTGLSAGACALDAGCASGAVTALMAERVGARGRVLGLDSSRARLAEARAHCPPSVELLCGDLRATPLRAASVDYVMCRLVLEYAQEPEALVAELMRVTRPGGTVVLTDVDGYGAFHHPLTDERRSAVEQLAQLLARAGFDAYAGRKLWGYLRGAGATAMQVRILPYHLKAGEVDDVFVRNWTYKLQTLAPLGTWALGEAEWERCARTVVEMMNDPEVFSYSTLVVAWGQRP